MNNQTEKTLVSDQILKIKAQSVTAIWVTFLLITGVVLFLQYMPYKWSPYLFINLWLGIMYIIIGSAIFFVLKISFSRACLFTKCLEVMGDESKSLLFLEEIRNTEQKEAEAYQEINRKSIIVGHVYAVISKDSQLTQIWFTEDETGWDLMQKFGWMQYKRVRKPYPSSTHDIHLVARNVEFDAKLHKQLKDPFTTEDERKLRREKYFRDTTTDYPFSIYAINYRLNKHLSTISVRHVDEEIYLARLVRDEFITVVKVCDKVKLSKAMTSAVYKVENSA